MFVCCVNHKSHHSNLRKSISVGALPRSHGMKARELVIMETMYSTTTSTFPVVRSLLLPF